VCSVLQAAWSGAGGSHQPVWLSVFYCFRALVALEKQSSPIRVAALILQQRSSVGKPALHALLANRTLWRAYN
jgi:hypothetical protein